MNKEIHATLQPKTNIILIVIYIIISIFLFSSSKAYPYLLVAIAILFGAIGGIMQVLSFKEGKEKFSSASTALDIRRIMMSTKWGKIYIYFLWTGNIILLVAALILKSNPLLDFLSAFIMLMLVRELITLKITFDLRNIE